MKNKIDKKVLFSIMIVIIISLLTNVVAETLINSKDVSYVDNSNLKATNVQAAIDGTCTKFSNDLTDLKTNLKKEILNQAYPINSVYISYSNTNPGTLFGGTWEIIGDGRVLKGIKSGTAGTTGGSSTVTLSMSNIPAHTHTYAKANANTDSHILTIDEMPSHTHQQDAHTHLLATNSGAHAGYDGWTFNVEPLYVTNAGALETYSSSATIKNTGGGKGHTHPISTTSTNTGSSGSSTPTAINVQDPYITVYMWRRTK